MPRTLPGDSCRPSDDQGRERQRTLDGLDELAEEPSEKDLEAIRKILFNAAEIKESWGAEPFDSDPLGRGGPVGDAPQSRPPTSPA